MKHVLSTCAALFLVVLAAGTTSAPAIASSPSASPGGIVLVAGLVVDLKWDPTQYPDPNGEPFLRWELWRRAALGDYALRTSGADNKGSFRDTVTLDDTDYWYKLEVVRQAAGGEERRYNVFGPVLAHSGTVAGTVYQDLTMGTGDFVLAATVVIPTGHKLTIGAGTTLRATVSSIPDVIQTDGGALYINGGTFYDNLSIRYGDPAAAQPTGTGHVKGALFESSPGSGYKPQVEIRGKGRVFDLSGNIGFQAVAYGANTLQITGNVGDRVEIYGDTVATFKQNTLWNIYLHETSRAVIEGNPLVAVTTYDEATAKIQKNDRVELIVAEDKSTVEILQNTQVRRILLQDQAQGTILGDAGHGQHIEEGIDVEGSASAVIRDNTVESGGILVDGYGAPDPNKKAYADITGNIITSPYKNDGVEVYRGATAKVRDGNLIEWTGYHGTEGSILLAAAGNGTELTAVGNTLRHGKLFIYDRANVGITDNVIEGGGAAITIGCIVCYGDVEGLLEHNTVQNAWGFEVWDPSARLVIRHNCIRGNDPGLTTDDYTMSRNVDMRWNWWGDKTGPYHRTNPSGRGDAIVGNKVDFREWDQTDTYCRNAPPPPQPPDLSVAGLEVVQSVQSLNNDVPFVAGKPAIVRAYVRSNTPLPDVAGKLEVYRDGALVAAPAPSGAVFVFWTPDLDPLRADLSKSINFVLDAQALTPGSYIFKFEIDPFSIPGDRDYSNNTLSSRQLTFQQRRKLRVLYVPIRFLTGGPGVAAAVPKAAWGPFISSRLQALYPLANVEDHFSSPINWNLPLAMESGKEGERARILLNRLNAWLANWNRRNSPQAPYDQVVGLISTELWHQVSFSISDPRWFETTVGGDDRTRRGLGRASYALCDWETVAHEIGHNLGLRHANTPDAGLPRPEDTYWDDTYKNATIQEYGYNSRTAKLVPKSRYDFMSYKSDIWISPLHYRMLFQADGIPPEPTGTAALALPQMLEAEQTYLLASGTVSLTGEVAFDPFWQITSALAPVNPPEGSSYCLELLSPSDVVLASQCFDLGFYNHETWSDTASDTFMVMLPVDPAAGRVALRQGTTELAQVPVSAHPPYVTLVHPNGGEILTDTVAVDWTATDSDGNPLTFNILYSTDGGAAWQMVAEAIEGVSHHELDLALVPGAENAWLRVEASDGYHTSGDTSDGPFAVPDKAPSVGIFAPEDGDRVPRGVTLVGFSYDPEDGTLDGSAHHWSSDLDGPLGSGNVLVVDSLTEGEHTITLSATDSHDQTGSDSVTVTVKVERIYLPAILRQG